MDLEKPVVITKKNHSRFMRWRIRSSVRKAYRTPQSDNETYQKFAGDVRGDLPSGAGSVVLLACNDYYYWHFAKVMLRSIDGLASRERVHLHLCEPSEETLSDIEQFAAELREIDVSWSYDSGLLANLPKYRTVYYASVRFLLASLIIRRTNSAILCLDVDGIARKPILSTFDEALGAHDVAVIKRYSDLKLVRRILASAVGISGSEEGQLFARRLGNGIAGALSLKPAYHVDQFVLYYLTLWSEEAGEADVTPMPLSFADHEFEDGSAIWTAKGWRRKNSEAFQTAMSRFADQN